MKDSRNTPLSWYCYGVEDSTLSDPLQVRGPPASGKTILTRLLAHHIRQQEPATHIISVSRWSASLEEVKEIGGWQAYLVYEKGWVQGQKTIFIFDDAQSSYEDFNLLGEFFKNVVSYDIQFVIAFASYGNPTRLGIKKITSLFVSDSQSLTLRPIDHRDGLGAVGLLFSRMEFNDLIRKRFSSSEHYFHPSFFDAVFDLTGGHVGAICYFVNVVTGHDVRFFMMLGHIT